MNINFHKSSDTVKRNKISFSRHFVFDKDLTIADVENAILNAYYCEKQKDELKQVRYKYRIYGDSLGGNLIVVVGKVTILEDEVFFVITAFVRR